MEMATQIILSVALIVIVGFLIFIGIQLNNIYSDLRQTLKRINILIDGFEKIGMNVEHGMSGFLGFFGGLKSFLKVVEKTGKKN